MKFGSILPNYNFQSKRGRIINKSGVTLFKRDLSVFGRKPIFGGQRKWKCNQQNLIGKSAEKRARTYYCRQKIQELSAQLQDGSLELTLTRNCPSGMAFIMSEVLVEAVQSRPELTSQILRL